MIMSSEDFGEYLSKLRKDRGLSIYRLSKESGVSHSYISQIENGKKDSPSPDVLKKLSGPLQKRYSELMEMAGHLQENVDLQVNTETSLEKTIRLFVHMLLGNLEHPFSQSITNDVQEMLSDVGNKHNIQLKIKLHWANVTDRANLYADAIISYTDNTKYKWDVLEGLKSIAHKYYLWFDEFGTVQQPSLKLEELLQNENLTYNGSKLTEPDRKRIIEMLNLLFPSRSEG